VNATDPQPDLTASPPSRWVVAAEIVLIVLVFFIFAGGPVPAVNEAQYLAKAKHYWDRDWCPDDHFLESADAHLVFYWTFGWLTIFLPLTAVAWIGRVLTWGLMAWAWRRLSFALIPRPLYAVLTASLFLCFSAHGHMAGEWVVGGVEAKGFAYVFVFLALEALVRNRWNRVWLLLGAASAFHALVGGWSVVAAGIAWLWPGKDRPPLLRMVPALAGGLLLALPGLVAVLLLNWGVETEVAQQAKEIYVFQRLSHHLVLHTFEPALIARFAGLVIVWAALAAAVGSDGGQKRVGRFVLGALIIAGVGAVIDAATYDRPDIAASLLRFYWFRLSDAMAPLGIALAAGALIVRLRKSRPIVGDIALLAAMLLAMVNLVDATRLRIEKRSVYFDYAARDVNFEGWQDKDEDWQDVCRWIARNTEPEDRFLTPRQQQTFKWFAGRSEVFSWKDVPQDAPGIVQWWERFSDVFGSNDVKRYHRRTSLMQLDSTARAKLVQDYDFQYVVVDLTLIWGPPPKPPSYRNRSFAVFRVNTKRPK